MVELNDETRWILGRPNFACAHLAQCLRLMGHDVKRRAEDEQAAAIHWMLCLYEAHGDTWREVASRLIEEAGSAPAQHPVDIADIHAKGEMRGI